jgi:hypothetical protein
MTRFILAALAAALAVPAAAQAPVTQAPSASYSAARAPKAAVAAPMRLEGAVQAHRVELARPGATERAKLAALNGNGSALSAPGMPQFIGFGRDVDAQKRRVDPSALTWTTTADGARVARIEVASLGAAGIRVALRMPTTHPDVKVRFAGGTATQAVASVPANAIAQATARFGEYWSPVIDGERAAIEIEVEKGATIAGLTLEIARVSHLVVGTDGDARRGGEDPRGHRRLGLVQRQRQVRHPAGRGDARRRGRNRQARVHRAVGRDRALHRHAAQRHGRRRSRRTSSARTTASRARTRRSPSTSGGSSKRRSAAPAPRRATTSCRRAARCCSAAARTGTGRCSA